MQLIVFILRLKYLKWIFNIVPDYQYSTVSPVLYLLL